MVFNARQRTAPKPDQVEVSLFGPGVGECAVVHLGLGHWMIVDSCIDRDSGRAIALEYLGSLGIDISNQVKLVVVTHWHNDHMRGSSELVGSATSADFFCSAALQQREYLEFVAAAARERVGSAELPEFRKIIEALKARNQTRLPISGIGFVDADTRIFHRVESHECGAASVWALSPSRDALSVAYLEFAEFLPKLSEPKKRAVALTANRVSLALWVEIGNARVLLGADLEEGGSPTMGWRAVVASKGRPQDLACAFKVPHHGSKNAHHDDVWTRMLTPEPAAILAPHLSGPKALPSDSDISRLKSKTRRTYSTTPPKGFRPLGRSPGVQKMIRRELRAVSGAMGHIRLRWDSSASVAPTPELFSHAMKL